MADPNFTIPKEIIEPIIQAHINKAVVEALNGPHEIVSKSILGIINMPVDASGKPSSYTSDRDRPWIDWVIGDCIRIAARAAIESHIASHQEQMKKILIKELGAKNSKLARQLAEGMLGAVSDPEFLKYRISVTFDGK
jgi:hypothetical protein